MFFVTLHPLRHAHDHKGYFDDKPKSEETPWGTMLKYYHKTFSGYLGPLIENGFEIASVEEPLPVGKRAKKEDSEMYGVYSSMPTRLAVKAFKK